MKKWLRCFVISILFFSSAQGQLLSWTPLFPVEANASQTLVITMDATKGNQGLLNHSPVTDVYVHIGVITNLSTSATDWKYVRNFGTPDNQVFTTPIPQLQATSTGSNKWSFTISGSLRTYFGMTNASETILRIAILFRSGNGSKVQRNSDGSDMYVPVNSSALAVRFDQPLHQPTYNPIPEPINKQVGESIGFTAVSNQTADLKLFLNGSLIQSANGVTSISANPTLTTAGNQTVIAEATAGTVTERDTLHFFVSPTVVIEALPAGVRNGINYEPGDTSVTLVLYAPSKNRVSIIGEFPGSNWQEQQQYVMKKTPDANYWWLRVTALTPGTEYAFQYLVDGVLKVGEPYAEKVLDPFHDASIPASTYPGLKPYPAGQSGIVSIAQTAAPAYNWSVTNFSRPDKRRLMIYEMLVRDFIAAQNWNVLRDTLNYLKNMGINAIEIMPFNEFDGNLSWGYNPAYFLAPDKYYGTRNALKQFIDSCHSKGMAVLMDIALNHTTGANPLAALYWNSANNQPAANNPWLNETARHPFNVFNDFNHESAATKYFFNRVVEHWLTEYKIDGFRFDLSKGFTQFNSGSDVDLWSQYDASRIAIWKAYYDSQQLKSPGSYAILEHFAANNEEIELSNYGMLLWGNLAHSFQEAAMGFLPNSNFSGGLFTVRNWSQPHLITYMESHDEERLMYKNINFGNSSGGYNTRDTNTALKRVEMNAAFLFSMPGPKMMWQFGELGYDYSINYCQDGTVNNNCRLDPKPIRWDYLQQVRRKRMYDVYSSLLKLRDHALYREAFMSNRVQQSLSGGVKWITITTDTSNLLVVGNFDLMPQTGIVTFPSAGTWYDYLNGSTITATGSAQGINLQPGEYHLYLNRNITNVVTTPVTVVDNTGNELLIKVYPNPVEGNAYVELNLPETGEVAIELINVVGLKVADVHNGVLVKGTHRLTFKSNTIIPGNYVMKVRSKHRTGIVKLVLK